VTLTQIQALTDAEINRRIAEWMGYTRLHWWCFIKDEAGGETWYGHLPGDPEGTAISRVPNYCGDLNAVHDVMNKLTPSQDRDFIATLWWPVLGHGTSVNFWTSENMKAFSECVNATARQRAEALLCVIEGEK
jgi:hypothetical protein